MLFRTRSSFALALLCLAASAPTVTSQEGDSIPRAVVADSVRPAPSGRFAVTIVEPGLTVARILAAGFERSVAEHREGLWCGTNVQTADSRDGFTIKRVLEVREEQDVRTDLVDGVYVIRLSGKECRDANGKAQPMIHSHPGGTCQAFPHDIEVILQRMAEFDGVLCGPRSHAWYFSKQLIAVWAAST